MRSTSFTEDYSKTYVESFREPDAPVDERRKALASDIARFLNAGGVIKVLPPAGENSGIVRAIEKIREAKRSIF